MKVCQATALMAFTGAFDAPSQSGIINNILVLHIAFK